MVTIFPFQSFFFTTLISCPALVSSQGLSSLSGCCLTRVVGRRKLVDVRTTLPRPPNLGGWPPYHPLPFLALSQKLFFFICSAAAPTQPPPSKSSHPPGVSLLLEAEDDGSWIRGFTPVYMGFLPTKKGRKKTSKDASHFTACWRRHAIFPLPLFFSAFEFIKAQKIEIDVFD